MNIDGNIYTGGNNVKFSYVVPRVTSLFDPDNSADGRIIKRLASVCVNYCRVSQPATKCLTRTIIHTF